MKKKAETRINVYLSFDGNCREAMQFYKDCFGGKLQLQTVGESPMAAQWPAEVQQNILHANLQNKELVLLASDMVTDNRLKKGNCISLALACSSEKQIEKFFARLSQGGKVTHPLHRFFDGTIGALRDKYGMNWVLKF